MGSHGLPGQPSPPPSFVPQPCQYFLRHNSLELTTATHRNAMHGGYGSISCQSSLSVKVLEASAAPYIQHFSRSSAQHKPSTEKPETSDQFHLHDIQISQETPEEPHETREKTVQIRDFDPSEMHKHVLIQVSWASQGHNVLSCLHPGIPWHLHSHWGTQRR